jgi:hypothetical protein
LTSNRFGDDCWPAAKPCACPEDAPASHEPQPGALVDACAAQLAVNAPLPSVPCEGDCAGVAGSDADADAAGVVGGAAAWVAVADPVPVGGAVGDWLFDGVIVAVGLVFDALGAGLPGVVAADVGI